jgi:hypothetical protein
MSELGEVLVEPDTTLVLFAFCNWQDIGKINGALLMLIGSGGCDKFKGY